MSRRGAVLFVTVAALWGIPYLLIKVALRDVAPIEIVFARTAIGALSLLPLAMRGGRSVGLRGRAGWLCLLAVTEMAAPFTLITLGERHLPSSLAGILIASVPLFVAVISVWARPDDRPRGAGLAGLVLGFAGVVVLLGIDVRGGSAALVAAGLVLLAATLYAISGFVLTRTAGVSPFATMAAVAGAAALLTLPAAAVSLPPRVPPAGTLLALAGLGTLSTGAAFAGFAALTMEVGVARASLVAYVAPGFAVVLGVGFRSEPLHASTVAGLVLVLGGSWFAARWRDGEPVTAKS